MADSDVTYTVNPRAVSSFNFDVGNLMTSFVGLWSPDAQPIKQVSAQPAQKDHISEMISSAESIRTVAAAVFDNVRPLKDKELNYLRKFYGRVYKKR